MYEKLKDKSEKEDVKKIIELSGSLFAAHQNHNNSNNLSFSHSDELVVALSVGSQQGLVQLVYLLVTVAAMDPDTIVDATNDATGKSQQITLIWFIYFNFVTITGAH